VSTFEAIGGVSVTLRALLADRVDSPPGLAHALTTIPVSIGTPPDEDEDLDQPRLNLFLYRVTRNAELANQEIPGHGANGAAYGHPPLSLNLHYLVTAYGASKNGGTPPLIDESVAQYLLGSAMRVLNDYAIITDALEDANGAQILDASLQNEYERVKLTLEPLTLEDVAKVWTALNRPYRLSAAYEVSVVQIESTLRQRHPQLVGAPPPAGPRVATSAAGFPVIAEVHAATRPGPYARVGETLVVTGSALAGDPTLAWIDGIAFPGAVTSARFDRATLVVPDDPRLQPGIRSLRIGHGAMFGEPPTPHVGPKSGTAAFVLVPGVDDVAVLATPTTHLRVQGNRLLAPNAECMTLVGERAVDQSDYDPASTSIELHMPIPVGATTDDLVRVRVNGAESLDDARFP
jgi:Pvc16 N-terminal domain